MSCHIIHLFTSHSNFSDGTYVILKTIEKCEFLVLITHCFLMGENNVHADDTGRSGTVRRKVPRGGRQLKDMKRRSIFTILHENLNKMRKLFPSLFQ